MASAFSLEATLAEELRHDIADNGIERFGHVSGDGAEGWDGAPEHSLAPAKVPPEWVPLVGRPLPEPPLAIAVDVYGTLLTSEVGEIGSGGAWGDELAKDAARGEAGDAEDSAASPRPSADRGPAFPHDMAERLRRIVAGDHVASRASGLPWPEVDSPSVFARALGLGLEDGARASVAWECASNRCAAMPGARAFLAACRERGLPLGIVSNAQFYTRLFIEEAFGLRLFCDHAAGCLGFQPELALWSFETGRAKPDPWMFKELARRLAAGGVPAGRILYVGNDALNDCAAAGEAGLMTALFAGDARSLKARRGDERVAAHPPTTVALSWDELRRLACT